MNNHAIDIRLDAAPCDCCRGRQAALCLAVDTGPREFYICESCIKEVFEAEHDGALSPRESVLLRLNREINRFCEAGGSPALVVVGRDVGARLEREMRAARPAEADADKFRGIKLQRTEIPGVLAVY